MSIICDLCVFLFVLLIDSRSIGNEIILRPRKDTEMNRITIADPSQTVLSAGLIESWQLFVTVVSSQQHAVYLQVYKNISLYRKNCIDTWKILGKI